MRGLEIVFKLGLRILLVWPIDFFGKWKFSDSQG